VSGEVDGERAAESARALDRKYVVATQLARPVEQGHVAGPTVREFPGCLPATDLVHAARRKRLLMAVYSEDHDCLLIELTMRGPGERNQRSGLNQTPIQRQRPAGSPGRQAING
jgi:hypothetical protein